MIPIQTIFRYILRLVALVVGLPLCLVVMLAAVLYVPAVQDAVVDKVEKELSASMQMEVSVERVRLTFPLTLSVSGVRVDDGQSLVLAAEALDLDIAFTPLFSGRVDVEQLALEQVEVDTKTLISETRLVGTLGHLSAQSRGVDIAEQLVNLNRLHIADAQLTIEMVDSIAPDTTTSEPLPWKMLLPEVTLQNIAVAFSMPEDSVLAFARIGGARLETAQLNLLSGHYSAKQFQLRESSLALSAGVDSIMTTDAQFEMFLQHRSAHGVQPCFAYFVDSLGCSIDSVDYGANGVLTARLRDATLREQGGLELSDLAAMVYMDSAQIVLPAVLLTTPHTLLSASANVPFAALEPHNEDLLRVRMDAQVGYEDVSRVGEMFDVAALQNYYPKRDLMLTIDAIGNVDWLELKHMDAAMPGVVELKTTGAVAHVIPDTAGGKPVALEVGIDFELRTGNMRPVFEQMGWADTTFCVPQGMTTQGTFDMKGNMCSGALAMTTPEGFMTLETEVDLASECYALKANMDSLSVRSFLPQLDMRPIVARLDVEGKRFDPMHPKAEMNLAVATDSLNYGVMDFGGMRIAANLAHQLLNLDFKANTTGIVGEGKVQAALHDSYDVNLSMVLEKLSMQQFAGAEEVVDIGTAIDMKATLNDELSHVEVEGSLCNNVITTEERSMMMKDIFLGCATNADTTIAHIEAGNLLLNFGGRGHVSEVAQSLDPLIAYIEESIEQLRVDHDTLKVLAPDMRLLMKAGADNPLTNVLRFMGYDVDTMGIDIKSAPDMGINGNLFVNNIKYGNLLLDEVKADISHGKRGIVVNSMIHNHSRKNPNKFKFEARAFLLEESVGGDITFRNKNNEVGFNIGLVSKIVDHGLQMQFYPETPIIAFRNFEINKDNYIRLDKERHFEADVRLLADDNTGFQLFCEPSDSVNDLTLSLSNVNLRELSNVIPYMPRLAGLLSADFRIMDDHKNLAAKGSVMAKEFGFDETKLGDLGADFVYLPKSENEHSANMFVTAQGENVMELSGTYLSEGDGWFEGEALLNSFPLAIANRFLKGTDIFLKGTAEGGLGVKGTLDAPCVNGELSFANAHIYSHVYSFDFMMDEKPIFFEDSRMNLKEFKLTTKGKEPLVLNGVLDMSNFDNVTMDFSMKGKNFELINAKRHPTSVAFGKLFVDVDCTMKGATDNLVVRGDLNILNRTNLTYILKDSPLTVENQLDGLVEFVDFELDETQQTEALPETHIDVTLGIGISEAANFHCNLSEDGKSYVDLQGGGNLTLRMTKQGEMRLIGRMTMEQGEMKYALPIIPMKTFKLQRGSYVEFTGDMMNPRLNIQAAERMKALVTEDEKQRSVTFDVGVAISKTLKDMGFEFTIEAPEDLSIQNQLATMTADQRSKTAVSLMATGLFIAEGNMATGGFQASSALNAFLQSEIQSIAGSALQTVDINFGVENSTTTTGATTTDYSFQFSKRFFGDRFAINVGGRVSTGSEADNSAASIIDNVTLEYRLDKGATRYVQVFYDRSTFDPLEGQLSKMGGGIVLRKKTSKLGELFIFR